MSLVARLRQHSAARPDSPWLLYAGRTITFAEADELSSAISSRLAGLGVQPGDRVGVCLHNVPQWPLAALGIWKCGASVVALSTLLRSHEVAKHLTDAGARALVVDDQHWADALRDGPAADAVDTLVTTSPLDLAGHALPRALVGTARPGGGADLLTPPAEPLPGIEPHGSDVAYLTFTSGTTGPAKAAMNTHANVAAGGDVYRDWCDIGDDDVVAALAPLFHVTGITGHLAVSLTAGVPLVLGYRFEAEETTRLLADTGATFTVAAVSALLGIVHAPGRAAVDLSRLRKLWSGGQAVAAATVDLIERELGAVTRIAYGMTETTFPALLVPHDRRAPVDAATGTMAVGLPAPGTEVWVVDEDDAPVGDGVAGEIVVRGPGVVPGYWERADETAATMPGGVLHTGDVGYRDADGWFYVIDRKKDLINTSGFKVWPREVEDALYGHPAVREVCVVGLPDDERGEVVTAFVSLVPGASLEPADLIEWSRERMAAYKYPRVVHVVDELPKTVTGKVLRRQLRDEGAP